MSAAPVSVSIDSMSTRSASVVSQKGSQHFSAIAQHAKHNPTGVGRPSLQGRAEGECPDEWEEGWKSWSRDVCMAKIDDDGDLLVRRRGQGRAEPEEKVLSDVHLSTQRPADPDEACCTTFEVAGSTPLILRHRHATPVSHVGLQVGLGGPGCPAIPGGSASPVTLPRSSGLDGVAPAGRLPGRSSGEGV